LIEQTHRFVGVGQCYYPSVRTKKKGVTVQTSSSARDLLLIQ